MYQSKKLTLWSACMFFVAPVILLLLDPSFGVFAVTSKAIAIPTFAERATYYDMLNVNIHSTGDDIKRSYRKIALIHHPDKAKHKAHVNLTPEEVENQKSYFVRVSRAYEILSDLKMKTRYDYLLSVGTLEYDEKALDWDEFEKLRGGTYTMQSTIMPDGTTKYFFKDAYALKEDQSADLALIISGSCLLACIAIPLFLHFKNKREESIRLAEEKLEKDRRNLARIEKIKNAMAKSQSVKSEIENDKKTRQQQSKKFNEQQKLKETTTNEEIKPKPVFNCTVCNKTYKTANQLMQHFESREHEKAEKAAARAEQSRKKNMKA